MAGACGLVVYQGQRLTFNHPDVVYADTDRHTQPAATSIDRRLALHVPITVLALTGVICLLLHSFVCVFFFFPSFDKNDRTHIRDNDSEALAHHDHALRKFAEGRTTQITPGFNSMMVQGKVRE